VRPLLEVINSFETDDILPDDILTEIQLTHRLRSNDNIGGKTWVIKVDGTVQGSASLTPVPAWKGVFDLGGVIAPSMRRRGLGSFLLKQMLKEIPHGEVRQITYAVDSMNSPVALFLQANSFKIEHVEWGMVLDDLSLPDPETMHGDRRIQLYNRLVATDLFLSLYEASFKGLSWYQPYQSAEEVLEEMDDDDSILILIEEETPVGFIWMRWPDPEIAEFEPIGVIQPYQNRGLGRYLLREGMRLAASKGAQRIAISVWTGNKPAIHLYWGFGFKHMQTTTFLGRDLHLK
jgi:ribosomal protein S18 acetylase RimI-like enzyme